jgi:hypothetical protein
MRLLHVLVAYACESALFFVALARAAVVPKLVEMLSDNAEVVTRSRDLNSME